MVESASTAPPTGGNQSAEKDLEAGRTANSRWRALVRPDDWPAPDPTDVYDLVVLGAGTGGLVSAAGSAGLGARVALVERQAMGGDCLNVGCVPSKSLLRAARAWREARKAREAFGGPAVAGGGSFAAVMRRLRETRARIAQVDSAQRFRNLGVDVHFGDARFAGPDRVTVGTRTLRFRRAIVATGGRARVPDVPGLREAGYHTNETIFEIEALPARIVVVGGGPIGCELAQAFAAFGSAVTIIDSGERVLSREHPAASAAVLEGLTASGIVVRSGARLTRVERSGEERVLTVEGGDGEPTLAADLILVSTGRTPNVEGLGLDAGGIALRDGAVVVDDRLRTSNRRVYAVGDVIGEALFTHAADAHARIAIRNAMFVGRASRASLVMSRCTYTSPEVAQVGLSLGEAQATGDAVEERLVHFSENDRAIVDGDEQGFISLIVARKSGRLLGGTIVGAHAGELIGELAVAVTHKLTLDQLGTTIHPYPTRNMLFGRAADERRRERLTPFTQRLFDLYFRLFRVLR